MYLFDFAKKNFIIKNTQVGLEGHRIVFLRIDWIPDILFIYTGYATEYVVTSFATILPDIQSDNEFS